MAMVTVSYSVWLNFEHRPLTKEAVPVMNSVLVMVVGKQHLPETFALVAVVPCLNCHRDFEMCIRSMVDVDVLFHMPLIWYVDDPMM